MKLADKIVAQGTPAAGGVAPRLRSAPWRHNVGRGLSLKMRESLPFDRLKKLVVSSNFPRGGTHRRRRRPPPRRDAEAVRPHAAAAVRLLRSAS